MVLVPSNWTFDAPVARAMPLSGEARNEADIVIGWRMERADTFARRAFSRFFYCIYQLGAMQQGFWWEFAARAHRRGFRIKELPVHHRCRAAGVTQVYGWKKMPGIFFRHVAAIFRIRAETRN